jgi:hypothetical protein
MAPTTAYRNNGYMNFRFTFVAVLALSCAQATMTATTSYSFGTVQPFDLYNGTTTSAAGVWKETIAPGVTTQSIVCVNAIGNTSNVCGNPGPDASVSISLPSAPQNQAILPAGTTNYLIVDGDDTYGAPVSTDMTGLTVGSTYVVTFFEASSEETPNSQADTDKWQVYVIPGATTGTYICPTCSTPVNPLPADLAYTSTPMLNPAGGTTNWQLQSFSFTATNVTELLEFVTDAVVTTGTAAVNPPLLGLTGVSMSQATPEPGTWVLTLLGAGLLFAGAKFRRRSSSAYQRVARAHVHTKQ